MADSLSIPVDYPALLIVLDEWHADAQARHPGVIPCRAGCDACCHGPFDISVADALLVRDAVQALPPDIRAGVHRRARAQMDAMRAREPLLAAPYDLRPLGDQRFDWLTDEFQDEPCPALDARGGCLIYANRPMICRLMGLGLETPTGDVIENACPIQDDYPAYRDLAPQPLDLDRWNSLEARAQLAAAERLFEAADFIEYETTVAGAILLGAT